MNLVLLEHQMHLLVTANLAFVGWVLQISGFDVLPYLFDDLGSGELVFVLATFSSNPWCLTFGFGAPGRVGR